MCETARSPSQVPQLRETARSPCQVPRQLIPCDMSRCMANVTFVRQLGALFFKFTSISLHEMSSHVMVWWDSGRVHHRRDPRGALRWQEGPERGSSVVRGGPERGSLVWQGGPERGSSVVKGDPLGAPLWQGGPERGSSVAGGTRKGLPTHMAPHQLHTRHIQNMAPRPISCTMDLPSGKTITFIMATLLVECLLTHTHQNIIVVRQLETLLRSHI